MNTLFDPALYRNGLHDGEARKQFAFCLHETHRHVFLTRGRHVLLGHLLEHGTATINDVRRVIAVPSGVDPVVLGSLPGPLARAGIIRRVGFEKTTRAVAHARHVARWELIDPAKAYAWLASNPLPAEQGGDA